VCQYAAMLLKRFFAPATYANFLEGSRINSDPELEIVTQKVFRVECKLGFNLYLTLLWSKG
jgi:hypothetical protein